jgi:hypothetical protein
MVKVDCVEAGALLRVGGAILVFLAIGIPSGQTLLANGKKGLMSHALLTNKRQGKMRLRDATNIIKPT